MTDPRPRDDENPNTDDMRDPRDHDFARHEFGQDDVDRFTREAGEGLRRMIGQFVEGQIRDKAFRSTYPFASTGSGTRTRGDARRTARPERGGRDGDDGVWAIVHDTADGIRVEQVFASEIDALRANQYDIDPDRTVALLPYGTPLTEPG